MPSTPPCTSRYNRGMGNAVQNRGGRPVKTLSPADWLLIEEYALHQLSIAACADRLGIDAHTLSATEGFTQVWAAKKAEGIRLAAAKVWEAADKNLGMPRSATRMFLAKAVAGYQERADSSHITLGPIQIALVGGQPGQSAQLIEGEPPLAAPALPSPPTDMPDISFA